MKLSLTEFKISFISRQCGLRGPIYSIRHSVSFDSCYWTNVALGNEKGINLNFILRLVVGELDRKLKQISGLI